jgi:hypothetical protein
LRRTRGVGDIRAEEFAFLANAILAGCSIQARSLTPQEASDAAGAVCNLGLENWPAAWRGGRVLPDDFLVSQANRVAMTIPNGTPITRA